MVRAILLECKTTTLSYFSQQQIRGGFFSCLKTIRGLIVLDKFKTKEVQFFPDELPVFTLRDTDQDWSVTQSSDFSVYLIVRVTKQTYKLREFSAVQGRRFLTKQTILSCIANRSSLFVSQKFTQSRATLTGTPAISPSCTMASGSTTALILVVKTVTSGALRPTTTARTSVGASVL